MANYKWFKVFDSREVAEKVVALNQVVPVELDNLKIALARNNKGFFAVNDACPHQAYSLSKGFCTEEGFLVCPRHRYLFNLENGKYQGMDCAPLTIYPIEWRDNALYVGKPIGFWAKLLGL